MPQSAATQLSLNKDDVASYAKSAGLRYVTDTKPGYSRKKHGKNFAFYDAKGKIIKDAGEIKRIKSLAIPPAYKNVWISPYANGHLQATGIDAKGRKQYRYHANWRMVRDASKFQHILEFGEALPKIRQAISHNMSLHGLKREKVLATVVALLEKTLIRVGNDEYAKTNHSYGLTTLHDEHVKVTGQVIRFRFKGKSGKEWNLKLSDKRIAKIIRQCEEIEGQELFKYVDDEANVHDITSGDVNKYLQEITGSNFTAKDYRTWTGTILAAMALKEYSEFDSEAQAKKNIISAIEHVAKRLGNTPTICRKCYIHPEILNAYMDGSLIKQISAEIDDALKKQYSHLTPEEIKVLQFLKQRLAKAAA